MQNGTDGARERRYDGVAPMLQPLLPYTPERDVYRLLGVPSNASTEEITAACRRLARTFHPDRNTSARANAEMQVVNAVRQVMSDPRARQIYDRERYRFHTQRARTAAPPTWAQGSTVVRSGPATASASAGWSSAPMPRRAAPIRPGAGVPLHVVGSEASRSATQVAVQRYVRALLVGARAILRSLAPPRCRGCRAVISGEDAYCAACGTPLLTGG